MRKSTHLRTSPLLWRSLAGPFAAFLITGLMLTSPPSSGASVARTAESSALNASNSCVKGTAQGITAKTAQVAVTVIDLTGGTLTNSSVGVPAAPVQEQYWNLVASHINKTGGAGCRQLQLHFYTVNPLDPSGAEQVCQTIAASHPFIVVDSGALSSLGESECIPVAKVPFVSQNLTSEQLTKYYPYYLSASTVPTSALHTSILALKQLGYFTSAKGFKKLGVLSETCSPDDNAVEASSLKEAGVPTNKIVQFSLGCPTSGFTPAALEQAVLEFKSDGVTDVTSAEATTAAAEFSIEAAQQNYKPMYLLTSDLLSDANNSGNDAGNPANINGAVNIATAAYGEQTTPGYKPSGGTKQCNAIFAPIHQTVYTQLDGYGGVACDYLGFVQALLNHATSLQPAKVVTAMHAIGSVDYSYPASPVNYSAAPSGAAYGVSYWRPEYYLASCKCWHVPNPTWNAPFK